MGVARSKSNISIDKLLSKEIVNGTAAGSSGPSSSEAMVAGGVRAKAIVAVGPPKAVKHERAEIRAGRVYISRR